MTHERVNKELSKSINDISFSKVKISKIIKESWCVFNSRGIQEKKLLNVIAFSLID